MTTSWLYPMKYLSKIFVPYGSFLKDCIVLTSMSSILVFFYIKITLVEIFIMKNYVLSTHSYAWWKKM